MCTEISEIKEQMYVPETKDNMSTTGHIRGRLFATHTQRKPTIAHRSLTVMLE